MIATGYWYRVYVKLDDSSTQNVVVGIRNWFARARAGGNGDPLPLLITKISVDVQSVVSDALTDRMIGFFGETYLHCEEIIVA
ncbi:MAG: hypothetical protein A3A73_01805 [Omnitrophica bacterium RIFCSPLOWO2_01_FULL_50_24]|nr:MAG: hypothetical protein A3A73_01805 [Omnitrophica bacterium RIFCSPLOWO2_01_FULL_50_24]